MDQYTRHKVSLLNVINTRDLRDKYPHTNLILCRSELLFKHVQTFTYEFYSENKGYFKVNSLTRKWNRNNAVPFTVIRLYLNRGPTKYLYIQKNSLYEHFAARTFNRIVNSHNSSFFVKTLCLNALKLKASDIKILLEYEFVKPIYQIIY